MGAEKLIARVLDMPRHFQLCSGPGGSDKPGSDLAVILSLIASMQPFWIYPALFMTGLCADSLISIAGGVAAD